MENVIMKIRHSSSVHHSSFTALIRAFASLSLTAFLFAASGSLSGQSAQSYEQLVAAHPDWVQVPGQLMRPDCVHKIPIGARVEISKDGQPSGDVTLNGAVIAHYDPCPEAPISTRHFGTPDRTLNHPPTFNGWVETSLESLFWLGQNDNIDYLGGAFIVPDNPQLGGSLIYIFNGIEPSTHDWILQPVLQYGAGPAGGGSYWAIASWIVGHGQAWHGPLQQVNSGDTLWGFTEQIGAANGALNYFIGAYDMNNFAYSSISTWSYGYHYTEAYQAVLEVYGVWWCAQLPSSPTIFYGNSVDHGYPNYNYMFPGFWGATYQSGCNDWVYVDNNSSFAVLYY